MTTPNETAPGQAPENRAAAAPESAAAEAPETAADANSPGDAPTSSDAAKKASPKDPLHGITLEMILTSLVERHGWEAMARVVDIKCFTDNPSIKSSLTFLRRTPWARQKVEEMYVTNDLRPAWRRRGKGRGPRS